MCYGRPMSAPSASPSTHASRGRPWTHLALGMLLLGGCGYYSTYVPPDNTRSRVTWEGDSLTVLAATDLNCVRGGHLDGAGAPTTVVRAWTGGYWLPLSHAKWVALGHDPLHTQRRQRGPHFSLIGAATTGGGDGGDLDEAFLVLAALAVAASNLVAIGLAAAPAEDGRTVAEALDLVNARNDRLRLDAAHCLSTVPEPTP